MNVVTCLYSAQYAARQWLSARLFQLGRKGSRRCAATDRCPPERILLVMSGLIGDTVLSTSVLVVARKLWPKGHITVLGRRHTLELLSPCPLINSVVETKAHPFSFRKRKEMTRFRNWLAGQKFDMAVIILGDQFALELAKANIPVRVGAIHSPLAPCLTHTYGIGSPEAWGPSERLNALRALGCSIQDVAPNLWISDAQRAAVRSKLAEWGMVPGRPYAVLHPFGSTQRQVWPLEQVHMLSKELWCQIELPSVLVGGPETVGLVSVSSGYLKDTTGKLSVTELVGLIGQAELVVSTDSGPYHIAGALGRPVVGLFRSRRPEHAHRYSNSTPVFGEDPRCQSRCRWDRCIEVPCRQMSNITVELVMKKVKEMVAVRRSVSG